VKIQQIAIYTIMKEIQQAGRILKSIDSNFNNIVESLNNCKGNIITTGVGKSGIIAKKLTSSLCSIGVSSFFIDPLAGCHGDAGSVKSGDIILAISNSGNTKELIEFLTIFDNKIISITENNESQLYKMSILSIKTGVQEEAGLLQILPTCSTTCQLILCDAILTCLEHLKQITMDDFIRTHPNGSIPKEYKDANL